MGEKVGREDRGALARERRLEILGLSALKFDIDHLANPEAVTRAVSRGRPWGGGGGVKGSDEDENLFACVYNLAGKQLRADRLIDQWIDRSRDARMPESCVTTTARALYTRCARDTRTLATIAGSALTRGGARTFSSWRYRAASRRPPTFRPSLPSPLPTPWPGERRRPPGGAAPGPQRISRCPLRSTMPAIGAPGARTVNQKNAR